jgi:hypothetical protein
MMPEMLTSRMGLLVGIKYSISTGAQRAQNESIKQQQMGLQ